ncbi:hypothetical protein CYLTODRAFT_494742 [Cylindrobasidium torrendii FP15055 ss-10]|uniref:Uncharacterized protein n=1 Tax=Cylindrobasidium torrendii FP15055 ss-10 TaxID=1314674 RepID=A0A0D7AYE0_9AGAR|nr:hypothetical protein CYLTODRAFT_494742 [Cylindrobasidium torrendii FP15055 ss-10]
MDHRRSVPSPQEQRHFSWMYSDIPFGFKLNMATGQEQVLQQSHSSTTAPQSVYRSTLQKAASLVRQTSEAALSLVEASGILPVVTSASDIPEDTVSIPEDTVSSQVDTATNGCMSEGPPPSIQEDDVISERMSEGRLDDVDEDSRTMNFRVRYLGSAKVYKSDRRVRTVLVSAPAQRMVTAERLLSGGVQTYYPETTLPGDILISMVTSQDTMHESVWSYSPDGVWTQVHAGSEWVIEEQTYLLRLSGRFPSLTKNRNHMR